MMLCESNFTNCLWNFEGSVLSVPALLFCLIGGIPFNARSAGTLASERALDRVEGIDNVILTGSAPEPASQSLMGAGTGLLGLAWIRRGRNNIDGLPSTPSKCRSTASMPHSGVLSR